MEEQNRRIIQEGFRLLEAIKLYGQINVVNKLETLGISLSPSTFYRIIKKGGGSRNIIEIAKGIQTIVEKELGYSFEEKQLKFTETKKKAWEEEIIPEKTGKKNLPEGFKFYEGGRLEIEEKVAFFSTAQREIIEFGVTLNTFSSYFYSRKASAFRVPVIQLLEKGVNLNCYLLDADCNAARLYFEDRKKVLPEDKGLGKIKESIEKLKAFQEELKSLSLKGKVALYSYKHVPNNYFHMVDGNTTAGKMMTSHYLYGERRASSPVFKFTKKDNRDLFRLYKNSLKNLIKGAKLLE